MTDDNVLADPQVVALQRQMSPLQRTVSALAAVNPTAPIEGMISPEAQHAAAKAQERRSNPLVTIEEGRGRAEGRSKSKPRSRTASENKSKERVHGKGLTEGDEEMEELPKNNLWLVMPAINLVAFVAALDQTVSRVTVPGSP